MIQHATLENPEENAHSGDSAAPRAAGIPENASITSDLLVIIDAWPNLPESAKKQILALVRAADKQYRRRWRKAKRQADVRGFASRLAQVTRDEQAVVALATRAIARFGGVSGLLSEMKQLTDHARQTGDLATAQRALTAVLNLTMAVGRLEHE
jgi:hypothetical protein